MESALRFYSHAFTLVFYCKVALFSVTHAMISSRLLTVYYTVAENATVCYFYYSYIFLVFLHLCNMLENNMKELTLHTLNTFFSG